jgi:hypothetical protein
MNDSSKLSDSTQSESSASELALADHGKLSVVFILPNLQINAPVETNYVGILPTSDSRVIEIAKRSPAVDKLISSFSDHHGSKISVSVMVLHQDAPKTIKDVTALVSFRNVLAISCVLQSWLFSIGSPNAIGTQFSDYFDFYPFGPTRDGVDLLHIGHGLNALDSADDFQGQPYPELSRNHIQSPATFDEHLFSLLLKAWVNRFEKGRRDWKSNKLFRSLAIAYHACSLPKKNSLWFYDLGVSVALWISAFETLVHPGRLGKSDLLAVLDLFSKSQFSDSVGKRQRKIAFRSQVRKGNAAAYLYSRLYESRNAFLHGNPVTVYTALYKSRNQHSLLTTVAPVLFNTALLCHFDWFNKLPKMRIRVVREKVGKFESDWKAHSARRRIEKALKHVLAGKSASRLT